jgi:hypothetical protein
MTASMSSDLTSKNAEITASPVFPAQPGNVAVARIDFARVANDQLFVYGWILGLTKSVQSASLYLGGISIDVLKQTIPVKRPDIAQHFSLDAMDDQHGFYALINLPDKFAFVDQFRLSITLSSGEKTETHWPLSGPGALPEAEKQLYVTAFTRLLPLLSRPEAKRLIQFAIAQGLPVAAEHLATLPPPVRYALDCCCVLENRILFVSGWVFDPAKDLTQSQIRLGESVFDLLKNPVLIPRPEVAGDFALYRRRDTPQNFGFVFAHEIPAPDREASEARFTFSAGTETVHLTRPLCRIPQDARREFLSFLSKLDSESVVALMERLAPTLLDNSPEERSLRALVELISHTAIERLPVSIQHSNPKYWLYIDQAIPVTDKGIFLLGWFNGDAGASPRIVCHCGVQSFVLSDSWIRHVRADVTTHLANLGTQAADDQHGFSCFVPLHNGDAPYYLSAVLESGDTRRMYVAVPANAVSAMQTVRALLTSFTCEHPDLKVLMDNQIGPAVAAAWAARPRPPRKPVLRSYGAVPTDPLASIIVPLYGRHDFAEHQMALFADDPDFQSAELIYVMDDPAIFAEFQSLCADLYGTYQVPFVLAFPGANLGFAGANNFGAEIARGKYLFLLNSDVLPKRPRWVSDLLRVYQSLPSPGLLGAKLLYEDGSVQHAGMAFRRYSGWGDLWINDHPFKGQSPVGLNGVRQVDAVTAACAIIEAPLYRQLGGLSEDYIIGDFEDSDLCLRATSAGRRNYVALDVELYHLERQSQNRTNNVNWRTNLTLYNCWLHNSRWAELIEKTRDRKASAYLSEVN